MRLPTGWVDGPHVCAPPATCHASVGKVGAVWRCDCGQEWTVVRRSDPPDPRHVGAFVSLSFVRSSEVPSRIPP